jgi:hypothetical protein
MAYKECERCHDECEAEEEGSDGCLCDTGYCLFCTGGCSGVQD